MQESMVVFKREKGPEVFIASSIQDKLIRPKLKQNT